MIRNKYVSPSVNERAFNCPHCGALAAQTWCNVFVEEIEGNDRKPKLSWEEEIDAVNNIEEYPIEIIEFVSQYRKRLNEGLITLDPHKKGYFRTVVHNMHISYCFVCYESAVWIHNRLIFPPELYGEEPNLDMPADILRDYEEARSILNLSPRGSAALLRLAVQKLCKHLGEKGERINDDIASLVKKGLDPMVEHYLHFVRVIGNEAVHPGSMDLRDDRDTASRLFKYINLIVEQMISRRKHLEDSLNDLPLDARAKIERPDAKKP